jgi:putative transposase
MPGKAARVIISERQKEVLEAIVRRSMCPQQLAQRAKIILLAFEGHLNEDIADRLNCQRHRVGVWRRRWARQFHRLVSIECEEGMKGLKKAVEEVLSDAPRSGWGGTFSAEQVTQILAVACEPPEESGRPVTHWTPKELADEVVKRGIVPSISARQVGRFLKSGRTETAPEPLLAECETG